MKKIILLQMLILLLLFTAGCQKTTEESQTAVSPISTESTNSTESTKTSEPPSTTATYHKITPEEAKKGMDSGSDYILLDVRTQEEYDEGHIDGALLIPNTEIANKASELLTDKSATIYVYCRSGRRSAEASKALVDMGYTAVYDFGGIIDWPYDVVK